MIHRKKHLLSICVWLCLTCLFTLLYGCKKEAKGVAPDSIPQKELSVVRSDIGFPADGGTQTLDVKSSSDWTAQVKQGADWISVQKKTNAQLLITATPSNLKTKRQGIINLTNKQGSGVSVRVSQMGSDWEIVILDGSLRVNASPQGVEDLKVEVSANTTYRLDFPEEVKTWIAERTDPPLRADLITKAHYLQVKPNTTNKKRTATITVQATKAPDIKGTITVTQEAMTADPTDVIIPKDKKLTVTRGVASSFQPGSGIDKSYDGVYGTTDGKIYHSKWSDANKFPVTLEYFFEGNDLSLDYIIYHPRGGNGNFGKVEVWIKTAQEEYKKVLDTDLHERGSATTLIIPTEFQGVVPTAVKFVVNSGKGGFASCSEMEFFHKNVEDPQIASVLQVFTDITCSALKSGVTPQQIEAMPAFFQQLARSLQDGTYPEDEKRFRIQTIKPYSNTDYWATKLRTNKYSHLNNPLGMVAKANQEFIVLLDRMPNVNVQLISLQDLGLNDGRDRRVNLRAGINKVKFPKDGQLFVEYEGNDPRIMPDLHIHIPPQTKDGATSVFCGFNVYDMTKDKTWDKYKEYLAKAKSWQTENNSTEERCVFTLVGERTIVTADLELLRAQDTKGYNINSGIQNYDQVLAWQHEYAGIEPFRKSGEFNAKLHVTTLDGGLYATNHRVNITAGNKSGWGNPAGGGFKNTFYREEMRDNRGKMWPVAHEMGHMNQGAIYFPSNKESSNNLFSNITVKLFNTVSTRGKTITDLANYRFAPQRSWARFGHPFTMQNGEVVYNTYDMTNEDQDKHGLYKGEDSNMHTRFYYQLWLYMDYLQFVPGFTVKLFELGRTPEGMLRENQAGQAQIQFMKNVCTAANMDMTEFFDAWGFLVPVKQFYLRAYGRYNYEVTQEMINEVKAFMSKFPTKCPPIHFIEDRGYADKNDDPKSKNPSRLGGDVGLVETFTGKVKITKDVKYSVENRKYTVTDGEQAVGFELRRPTEDGSLGKLVWFTNRFNFTVPNAAPEIEGAELYAVQYDGKRVKATRK